MKQPRDARRRKENVMSQDKAEAARELKRRIETRKAARADLVARIEAKHQERNALNHEIEALHRDEAGFDHDGFEEEVAGLCQGAGATPEELLAIASGSEATK
jgi:hypothetical protein